MHASTNAKATEETKSIITRRLEILMKSLGNGFMLGLLCWIEKVFRRKAAGLRCRDVIAVEPNTVVPREIRSRQTLAIASPPRNGGRQKYTNETVFEALDGTADAANDCSNELIN